MSCIHDNTSYVNLNVTSKILDNLETISKKSPKQMAKINITVLPLLFLLHVKKSSLNTPIVQL